MHVYTHHMSRRGLDKISLMNKLRTAVVHAYTHCMSRQWIGKDDEWVFNRADLVNERVEEDGHDLVVHFY